MRWVLVVSVTIEAIVGVGVSLLGAQDMLAEAYMLQWGLWSRQQKQTAGYDHESGLLAHAQSCYFVWSEL